MMAATAARPGTRSTRATFSIPAVFEMEILLWPFPRIGASFEIRVIREAEGYLELLMACPSRWDLASAVRNPVYVLRFGHPAAAG